jgi:glycerol 3-phosphatase-2
VSVTDSLVGAYAAVVCDLDGVVYRGPEAVPHAVEALRRLSVPLLYATNNASRTPEDVARHLTELGLECSPQAVATSAQAAAWLLGHDLDRAARVLAVGGDGVAVALGEAGFEAVRSGGTGDAGPSAVVQGYGPGVTAADLAEAAYAIEAGARWVATNTDATLPTNRGVAPGNGSLVAAVARAVGHEPDAVAGKPEPPLYRLCAERLELDVTRVLAVGDRLETDIAGAVAAGMDSLLVLTGVDDLDAVLDAPAGARPTHVATDLRALHLGRSDAGDGTASVAELTAAVERVHEALDGGEAAERVSRLRRAARDVLDGGRHG